MTPRHLLALLAASSLLVSGWGPASAQTASAVFGGTVFDPSGQPAAGFQVVYKDVSTGAAFTSSTTDARGQYQATVPVGGRYKLEAVIAPDGTRLPVQEVPPVAVRTPGRTRLDVSFRSPAPEKKPDDDRRRAVSDLPEKKLVVDAKKPWWKTPWGVTGIVLGAGAVAALALGNGDGDPSPSR